MPPSFIARLIRPAEYTTSSSTFRLPTKSSFCSPIDFACSRYHAWRCWHRYTVSSNIGRRIARAGASGSTKVGDRQSNVRGFVKKQVSYRHVRSLGKLFCIHQRGRLRSLLPSLDLRKVVSHIFVPSCSLARPLYHGRFYIGIIHYYSTQDSAQHMLKNACCIGFAHPGAMRVLSHSQGGEPYYDPKNLKAGRMYKTIHLVAVQARQFPCSHPPSIWASAADRTHIQHVFQRDLNVYMRPCFGAAAPCRAPMMVKSQHGTRQASMLMK